METNSYRIIKTEDGTDSVYSDEYGQAMHSISGAYQESVLKHVFPSQILEKTEKELFVLDIGFGIGYNILALINEFTQKNSGQKLNVISLEKDLSHCLLTSSISFKDARDHIYEDIRKCISLNYINTEKYSIKIIPGDARSTVRSLNKYLFDAVFHDPYSPAKNPELWSVNFFKEIHRLMKEDTVLTTYSSALQIRMALIEAGFNIAAGPSVGKKKEGTLASPGFIMNKLSEVCLSEIKANIKAIPYIDSGLNDAREVILNRRIEAMKKMRLEKITISHPIL